MIAISKGTYSRILLCLIALFVAIGCGEDDSMDAGPTPDDFDRQAMLVNWTDNIIIPAYTDLAEKTEILKTATLIFVNTPVQASLTEMRNAWEEAYLSWQRASMFEIGPAETLRLRDNMNIYPTDTSEIRENILTGSYDLTLPSFNDQQGFPALDYLLYGLASDDAAILAFYNDQGYRDYVEDLTKRMDQLADNVLSEWTGSYRDNFVNNDGNSATASVDKLVNDYVYYYEKSLRAGKIGIPAGVFSGMTLNDRVEGFYRKDLSKTLFLEALQATQNFFNGIHYENGNDGTGMDDYLDYLNTIKNGTDLTTLINDQFEVTRNEALTLDENFHRQVETDNAAMLATYDELQKNVILLKVDMLQALNINVDFVDADGD